MTYQSNEDFQKSALAKELVMKDWVAQYLHSRDDTNRLESLADLIIKTLEFKVELGTEIS